MPRILSPAFRAHHVTDIPLEFFHQHKLRGAILDLDGSLIGFQHRKATPEIVAWVANLLTEGIRLCIVSNPGPRSSLAEIAAQLGLTYFRGAVPKPLPRAFIEARVHLDLPFSDIAMLGDQLFTDILGGNLLGMTTVWLDTIPGSAEGLITATVNRPLEKLYRRFLLNPSPSRSPFIDSE